MTTGIELIHTLEIQNKGQVMCVYKLFVLTKAEEVRNAGAGEVGSWDWRQL